jgi:hypothetical protein
VVVRATHRPRRSGERLVKRNVRRPDEVSMMPIMTGLARISTLNIGGEA